MQRRRTFLAALAACAGASWQLSRAGGIEAFGAEKYAQAIVIDALGGPGGFAPDLPDDAPFPPAFLADVRASGVTLAHVTVGEVGNAPDRFEKTIESLAGVEHEIASHPDIFLKVLRASDIKLAKSTNRMGLVYGFQDTSMLQGDLKRLSLFHDLGIRICQPTYNRRNLMGDGCLEPGNAGLSRLGFEFVAEVNRLHILLDLSHAGVKTIADGIQASTAPAAITHTGCRALVDVPRNTHDRELRALADRGGVAGIYFMPFLKGTGQPHAEDLIRHLDHAVNVCGEDHVGLGTDGNISGIELNDKYREFQKNFYESRAKAGIAAPGEAADVFNLIPEYNEPRRFARLADDLSRRGWPDRRIEKVLGANFARLFAEVWGA